MKTLVFDFEEMSVTINDTKFLIFEREYMIPPKRVCVHLNCRRGTSYKYCYYDDFFDMFISLPLPYCREVIDRGL
jgi:hypothetical protein